LNDWLTMPASAQREWFVLSSHQLDSDEERLTRKRKRNLRLFDSFAMNSDSGAPFRIRRSRLKFNVGE